MVSNSKPLPEGTVIMAENQLAGRGQRENKWFSDPGKNLLMSILLTPAFLQLNEQFDLNRVVALGVTDALRAMLDDAVQIKWPNDIYYGNKKLGGILIENLVQGSQIKQSVIGIGLNVNQETFPDNLPNAISVAQILREDYDIKALLAEICAAIESWYLRLKQGKKDFVRKTYIERLYWYNEQHLFKVAENIISGKITGVADNGKLLVNTNNEKLTFDLKEIEFLISG